MNPKQNLLKLMRTGYADYFDDPWSFNTAEKGWWYLTDPYTMRDYVAYAPGMSGTDPWGVSWHWAEDAPAAHPSGLPEDIPIKDITRWQEQLSLPDISGADWTETENFVKNADRDHYFITMAMWPGIFERANMLLGFENGLMAFYEHPKETYELYEAICDVKIKIFDELMQHVRPDMIHHHDDWGSKLQLFLRPEMWRKMVKPHYQRFYGHIKEKGVMISHHADCYCQPIVDDMIELGIDIWQGVTPENDIRAIQAETKGKIVLMGGIPSTVVDRIGISEAEIREEVRSCVKEYCPGGYFIPCVTSECAFTPGVQEIINDELRKCRVPSPTNKTE